MDVGEVVTSWCCISVPPQHQQPLSWCRQLNHVPTVTAAPRENSCCQKSRDAVWKSISKHGVPTFTLKSLCLARPTLTRPATPLSSVDTVGFPITGGAAVDLLIISCLLILLCWEKVQTIEERRACAASRPRATERAVLNRYIVLYWSLLWLGSWAITAGSAVKGRCYVVI